MLLEEPYFMKNKEWYWHDAEEFKYKLTDKAPQKAKESYIEFYEKLLNSYNYSEQIVVTMEDIEKGIEKYKTLQANKTTQNN